MRVVRAALLFVFAATTGGAQPNARALSTADSLLTQGRVFDAESILYRLTGEQPREPKSRLALGRYLASRGALKVGSVLLEEARFFGGDPADVARELAPLYDRLRDYRTLAALPATPLPVADRRRAEWLSTHAPLVAGPDSVIVPWATAALSLGRIEVGLRAETREAFIDPAVMGMVLDTSQARREGVRTFTGAPDVSRTPAVLDQLRIGQLQLTNVPARFMAIGRGRVLVGLDVIEGLRPTFDEARGQLVLHRAPLERGAKTPGVRYPMVFRSGVLSLVVDSVAVPVANPKAAALLRGRRWTLDVRRGSIFVE